jgi:fatty-acyl-CoA synthase
MVLMGEFSPRRALEVVRDEQITMFHAVDTMVRDMAGLVDTGESPRPTSLERVAVIPVTRAIAESLRSSLGVRTVYSGYGLTEASAASSFYRVDGDASNANVLTPLPGVEFQVRAEVPGGTVGELWLRSPGVMRGYYRRPDDTATVLRSGGWLRTGDLAEVTHDGAVHFLGRVKEIIRTGGFNVAPLEVEDVLRQHPDIADAAVVAVPDDRLGEVGIAFLRVRPGRSVTPDTVLSFCRARLADFKVPRTAVVVDGFPMTGSGKVQKVVLREDYLATQGVAVSDNELKGRP